MKLTNAISRLLAITSTILVISCNGCGEKQDEVKPESKSTLTSSARNNITGVIGEGTTMNVLELVTLEGDTLNMEIGNDRFFGGKIVGDTVQVTYISVENQLISSTVVNLMTLRHVWAMHDDSQGVTKYLELDPNGRAHLFVDKRETNTYESWKLDDGFIALTAPADTAGISKVDTIEIQTLDTDTMTIANGEKTLTFWRYN